MQACVYLCSTWDGSDVDRGHHEEENCTFKTVLYAIAASKLYKSHHLTIGQPCAVWASSRVI